jgi:hypothetical protein
MRRLAILLAVLFAPLPAHAASVAPHGKVRVHVDTEVFAWSSSRTAFEGIAPLRTNVIGIGVGRPVTLDGALGQSLIGLGVGYGVHRHLIFGARLGLNYSSLSTTTALSSTLLVGTFTPYLEILPLREGPILPFILLRTGVSGGFRKQSTMESRSRNDAVSPLAGIGVGAHGFIGRHFSLDLAITFDYRWNFTANQQVMVGDPPPVERPGWQHSSRGFTLAASLGLSTWF